MVYDCIKVISEGMATRNNKKYQWKEFLTQDEHTRIIAAQWPDERIYETFYDPYKEEFKDALNRILPDEKVLNYPTNALWQANISLPSSTFRKTKDPAANARRQGKVRV